MLNTLDAQGSHLTGGLQKRIALYEQEKKSTNAIEQHRLLNSLKETEFPWMYEVSKCAAQEALRDLDRAFQNFFRGLKTKQQLVFPHLNAKETAIVLD